MDNIIKGFMVIFTNESSTHILLNDDLIEITLSCLENSDNITLEAQINVSELLSKVLQYPQIQEQILIDGSGYFKGLNFLLNIIDKEEEKNINCYLDKSESSHKAEIIRGVLQQKVKIVKFMIEACYYLSKNPIFFME